MTTDIWIGQDFEILNGKAFKSVLISYFCYNKLPHTQWLKKYTFIIRRSEHKMSLSGLKKGALSVGLLLETIWQNPILATPSFRGGLYALTHGPFFHLQSQHCCHLSCSFFPSSFHFKDPCDCIELIQIIQNNFSILRLVAQQTNSICIFTSSLPYNLIFSGPGVWIYYRYLQRGHYSA